MIFVAEFSQPFGTLQFLALNTTVVKPVQPEKALSPIEVTELGIVTEVKLVQPEKASEQIEVTELGIIVVLQPAIRVLVAVSTIALQLSRES